MSLYKNIREKFYDFLPKHTIYYLEAGKESVLYNTDRDMPFRQESNFMYLTGCDLPNVCAFFDSDERTYTLFVERLGEEHALWIGPLRTLDEQKESYGCDFIYYVDNLHTVLTGRARSISESAGTCNVMTPNTFNEISRLHEYFPGGEKIKVSEDDGYAAVCRLYKTNDELEVIRHACKVNSDAITYVMKNFRHDIPDGTYEYTVQGMYRGYVISQGCGNLSFEVIASVDKDASILHNLHSDKPVKDKQVFLLDVGCESKCYCSDHTRCFPTGKRFTPRQEAIYNIVLRCNKECIEMARPGVAWTDVHLHGLKVLLEGLREEGLIHKDTESLEKQLELGVPSFFQPHGLGHLLGMNDHDVAGYIKVHKDSDGKVIGFEHTKKNVADFRVKYLRTNQVLEEGMCITVEPGCYFIPAFLSKAKADPELAVHFNFEKINEYMEECGGYRLEDDIHITRDGNEILPAPVKELEEVYALRDIAYSK